jgi:hypothetical protein
MKKLILSACCALLAVGSLQAQTEMTIAEAQTPDAEGDASSRVGELVTVEGLALSSSEHFYSGSHSSFYLIDENGGEFGGILVYHGDGEVFDIYVGDRVRVTGIIQEYSTSSAGVESNMTEIVPENPDTDVEIISYENPLPSPIYVDMWDLDPVRHNDHVAENMEAMLVEILDAVVVDNSAPPSWHQFTVADPDGNEAVVRTAAYELGDYGRPPLGATFEMIRGVVYDVYGNYNVMPRDADDLILAVGPPIISGTTIGPCGVTPADPIAITTNISDNTAVDEAYVYYRINAGEWNQYDLTRDGDNPIRFFADLPPQAAGSMVEIAIEGWDDEGNQSWYPAGGLEGEGYEALFVTDISPTTCFEIQSNTYADGGSAFACHEATLTAIVTMDYDDFGFTEEDTYRNYILADAEGLYNAIYVYNNDGHGAFLDHLLRGDEITITGEITEYNGLTELSYISSYTLLSQENELPATAISLGADFDGQEEPYESVLVTIEGVTVLEDAGFGEWLIQDASGSTILLGTMGNYELEIAVGSTSDSITGVITYGYGSWKLAPRNNDDFVNFTDLDAPRQSMDFRLLGNYPNPFNPTTSIAFELDRAGDASLVITNLLGEQVALIECGVVAAGRHQVQFDASHLATGTYFSQLQLNEEKTQAHQMLLIK